MIELGMLLAIIVQLALLAKNHSKLVNYLEDQNERIYEEPGIKIKAIF